jgi:hypothetical protein
MRMPMPTSLLDSNMARADAVRFAIKLRDELDIGWRHYSLRGLKTLDCQISRPFGVLLKG